MQNDTNDNFNDKQPLLNHIRQSDDVMNHCIAMYMHVMSSCISHNCCIYGDLLQTSCAEKDEDIDVS